MIGTSDLSQDEIVGALEDPFSIRFIPDAGSISEKNRFFSLGISLSGTPLFTVYKSNGKSVAVITAREMTHAERLFYERKARENY